MLRVGDILGNLRVRISDPWEKVALENFILFWLETSKNDHTEGGRVNMKVTLPSSSGLCAFLFPRKLRFIPRTICLKITNTSFEKCNFYPNNFKFCAIKNYKYSKNWSFFFRITLLFSRSAL